MLTSFGTSLNLPLSSPPSTQILQISFSQKSNRQVKHLSITDGKCQGMMAPERLNILHAAFHTAKLKGLHNNITPAPESFASELLRLLTGKAKLAKKVPWQEDQGVLLARSAKSLSYCLPKTGSGYPGKMASPLDFNPSYPHNWSANSRGALFGAHLDSLSSKSTGISVCHPIYYYYYLPNPKP